LSSRLGLRPGWAKVAAYGRARLSSDVSEIKLVFSIPPHRPTPNIAPSWNVAPTVVRFGNPDPPALRALVETLGDRRYTIHVTGPRFQLEPDPKNPKPTLRDEQQLDALKTGRNFDFVVGEPVAFAL
jgi:hypothetical protein